MLPFNMFDAARKADEALRAEKLASIYHKGQVLAWDGKKVLADLIAKHGGIHMEPRYLGPIRQVFSILMWGELAAWKISAQLADQLVELEPKMAATSQVFDEARHFYVLHDYLVALGQVPGRPEKHALRALNMVLDTRSLPCKLVGMQMLFEPTALTIFKFVRELRIEPVLADLLTYFEKDEARHVGLGVQALPVLVREMWPHQYATISAFQLHLVGHILLSLKSVEPALNALGISTRSILESGVLRHQSYAQQVIPNLGPEVRFAQEAVKRAVMAVCEVMFPEIPKSASDRLVEAARVLRYGADFLNRSAVDSGAN